MLTFTSQNGPNLAYEITGRLTAAELRSYYATIEAAYEQHGGLHLTATARNFTGYAGAAALLTFLAHEPKLLKRVEVYELRSNQKWLREIVNALDVLTPGVSMRAKKIPAAPGGVARPVSGGQIN